MKGEYMATLIGLIFILPLLFACGMAKDVGIVDPDSLDIVERERELEAITVRHAKTLSLATTNLFCAKLAAQSDNILRDRLSTINDAIALALFTSDDVPKESYSLMGQSIDAHERSIDSMSECMGSNPPQSIDRLNGIEEMYLQITFESNQDRAFLLEYQFSHCAHISDPPPMEIDYTSTAQAEIERIQVLISEHSHLGEELKSCIKSNSLKSVSVDIDEERYSKSEEDRLKKEIEQARLEVRDSVTTEYDRLRHLEDTVMRENWIKIMSPILYRYMNIYGRTPAAAASSVKYHDVGRLYQMYKGFSIENIRYWDNSFKENIDKDVPKPALPPCGTAMDWTLLDERLDLEDIRQIHGEIISKLEVLQHKILSCRIYNLSNNDNYVKQSPLVRYGMGFEEEQLARLSQAEGTISSLLAPLFDSDKGTPTRCSSSSYNQFFWYYTRTGEMKSGEYNIWGSIQNSLNGKNYVLAFADIQTLVSCHANHSEDDDWSTEIQDWIRDNHPALISQS